MDQIRASTMLPTLPTSPTTQLAVNVRLQRPLSRRGHGPGLLVLKAPSAASADNKTLDPDPIQKWAEEGFAVIEVTIHDEDDENGKVEWNINNCIANAITTFTALVECSEKHKFGVIVHKIRQSGHSQLIDILGQTIQRDSGVKAIVSYEGAIPTEVPQIIHIAGSSESSAVESQTVYGYPSSKSANFILPTSSDYKSGDAGVAHTRSLGFLRKHIGGPNFDLEAIWDEHTLFEFGERNVEKTMGTMVQEPYVNHVPTMTGGIGRAALTDFYRDHFIFNNPEDTALELVSRTVGVDRVIDEFIFSFTHDKMIDWLIPGIPPTGKSVRVPFTSIVNVRGDRLYHEHIAWDQASVLVQLGLLPEYLPFPYPLPDGRKPAPGKRFEYRVPAAGKETATKLMDEAALPSNEMLGYQIREVDDI